MACGVLSGKYQSYPYEGSDLALKEAKRERKLQCESVQVAKLSKAVCDAQCEIAKVSVKTFESSRPGGEEQ